MILRTKLVKYINKKYNLFFIYDLNLNNNK